MAPQLSESISMPHSFHALIAPNIIRVCSAERRGTAATGKKPLQNKGTVNITPDSAPFHVCLPYCTALLVKNMDHCIDHCATEATIEEATVFVCRADVMITVQ